MTVVAHSRSVGQALDAAKALEAEHGIKVEVHLS
jgi:pyruvate/2-oxoglutarate/acetoin dehydrogenase E1 component